jgi:hypothetical protein
VVAVLVRLHFAQVREGKGRLGASRDRFLKTLFGLAMLFQHGIGNPQVVPYLGIIWRNCAERNQTTFGLLRFVVVQQ